MKKQSKVIQEEKPIQSLRENTYLIDIGMSLDSFLEDLRKNNIEKKHFSFDVETDGKHFILAKLEGIGFYLPYLDRGYYINLKTTDEKWIKFVLESLRPFFEDEQIGKIGQNIIYDVHIMKNYGVDVNGHIFDTLIACYLVNPDDRPFKLKVLVPKHLKIQMRQYKEIDTNNIVDMAVYCMEDARCTYLLYLNRKEALLKNNLWRLFNDTEMPFLKVLFKMERRGIRVDVDRLAKLRTDYEGKVEILKNKFCLQMFGYETDKVLISVPRKVKGETKRVDVAFNIDSPSHLGELFYHVKKYPIHSRTPIKTREVNGVIVQTGGKPSTDKVALTKLAERGYEGLDILLEYRLLETLLKTFIRPILDEHMIQGRLYPSYLQHGTRTGRLSSSNPNFQNIPKRSDYGKEIRRCFIADPGTKIIDADLSQIDLRCVAHFSKDPNMVQLFKDGVDFHTRTGQRVFKIITRDMTDTERTLCKNLIYCIQFGGGPRKFALLAKISEEEAAVHFENFYREHPLVKTLQVNYPKEVRRIGYATTILGRKRYLPNIFLPRTTKDNWKKISGAEREAVSTLIQGTTGDIVKLGMLRADKMGLAIVAQIHDELLVISKEENVENDSKALKDCMENCGLKLAVPVVANMAIMDRWAEKKEGFDIEDIEEDNEDDSE